MNSVVRYLFIVYGVLGFLTVAYSQTRYHVSIIDTEAGLPLGTVYTMYKDSQGFVWMGASNTLSRYDGNEVRNFDTRNKNTAALVVRNITEDSEKNLWLSVGDALVKFERKKETFTFIQEKSLTAVKTLMGQPLARIGTKLWCISHVTKQLFSYDMATRRKTVWLTHLPLLDDTYFFEYCSAFEGQRFLWIHLTEGILRFDTQTGLTAYFFSPHPANRLGEPTFFTHFILQKEGVYLAKKDQTTVLLSHDMKTISPGPPAATFSAKPNTIITLPTGVMRGVRTFDDGVLWIAVPGLVYKLNPQLPKFKKVTASTHPTFDKISVRGVLPLNDTLWRINLSEKQVQLYNRKSDQLIAVSPRDRLNTTGGRTARTRDGNVWVMAESGLCEYSPDRNKLTCYPNPDTLEIERRGANAIHSVFEINAQTLLLSTEAGVYTFSRTSKKYHRIAPFGVDSRVSLRGYDGTIYISTKGEILHIGRLMGTKWQPIVTPLHGYRFRNGVEDTLRQQILGASVSGLKVISKKDWSMKKWTEKDGLANEYIYDVLTDRRGIVWVSTNRGLSSIDLDTRQINNFKLSDGLQGLEFNSRTAAILPNGELFFGGTKGFNYFNSDDIRFNTNLPKAVLTGFNVKEKPHRLPEYIGEAKSLRLNHESSSFSINYSAIDYFSNGQNTYQYRLMGLDSTWITANAQTTARFVQVPAGQYTFELKAANSDGLWNNSPTRVGIEILPQFWETLWFRAVMLLLLGTGLFGFYRYRLHVSWQQQRAKMAMMVQTQEEERHRFAQDLHDGFGANLSTIKIILGLISDPTSQPILEKAEAFLDESLDDLRQMIHAMSPRSLTRLGLALTLQELAIIINQTNDVELEIYADDFPEHLSEEVEVNLFRIVQELIQNAIKHAQATHITITLYKTATHLIVNYVDDGCGFDTARPIQSGNGLFNLQTRAQLLSATLKFQSTLGEGTTVHLEMPL